MSGDRVTAGSLGHIASAFGLDFHGERKKRFEAKKAERQQRSGVVANYASTPKQETPAPPMPRELVGYPPGVAGMAARWLEAGNTVNNPQASIVSVLAFASGVCGRSVYNDSAKEDGTNLYMCLIAPSAGGKEWMWGGCSKLIQYAELEDQERNIFGPRPASGQVLSELLQRAPSTIIPLPEMGKWMQRVFGRNANGAEVALQGEILTLYTKSARGATWCGSATKGSIPNVIRSPSITIVGESTPSTMWASLSGETAASGFVSRFVMIEAGIGEDRYRAKLGAIPHQVHDSIEQMRGLWTTEDVPRIAVAWPEEVDKHNEEWFTSWSAYKSGADQITREIISRTRQNAPRIAAVLAIWDNPRAPAVTKDHVDWAWQVANMSCRRILEAYKSGEIVSEHQGDNVQKVMDYCIKSGGGVGAMIEKRKIVDGIKRKVTFQGASYTPAIKEALAECMSCGLLQAVPADQRPAGTLGEVYLIVRGAGD